MSNGNRPLIVVPSDDPAQCQGSPRMADLEAVADLKIFPTRADSFHEQIERAQGATVIINSRSYLEWREDAFNLLPDLRFISVCGIGTDSIDLDAARDHGITVSNIPGKTAPVVAEHAFGLMFRSGETSCLVHRDDPQGRVGETRRSLPRGQDRWHCWNWQHRR